MEDMYLWDEDLMEALHQSNLDFATNKSPSNSSKHNKNSTDCIEFSKLEFGNFDDREMTTFRRVTTRHSFHDVHSTSFKVYWKEGGDFSVFFLIKPHHQFWIEINRNIIRKVIIVDNESIAIVLDQAPSVHRKRDGDDNKTRMAAPTDQTTQAHSFWLHNFNVTKSLLLSGIRYEHVEILKSKTSKTHYLYGTKSCTALTMKDVNGMDWKGQLNIELGIPFHTMYLLLCLNCKVPGLLASYERLSEIKQLFNELKDSNNSYDLVNVALEKCLQHEGFFPSEFTALFKKHSHKRQHKSFVKVDDNMFEIRKVMITPTGIKYFPKILESGNRVLRKYKQYEDRFLRVTFCDEGLNRVSAEKVTNMHPRLEEFLNNGFTIGNRHYEMLAYSNSQLRSHSCWFLNTEGIRELSVSSIIKGLGDFSDIKVMAKYAARIGQCFSNTFNGIKSDFIEVNDIVYREIERNGDIKENVLNDGCGRMSVNFAEQVSKQMKIRIHGKAYIPSALQFRLGGYKGVVVQDKDVADIFGKDLVLTKSQNKFKDEKSDEFEMVAFSKRPKFSSLNRQIIILLSSNGLPDSALMKFVDREIETWRSRTTKKLSIRKLLRKVWENVVGSNIKKVISSEYLDLKAQVLASQVKGMSQQHVEYFYNVDPLLCTLCDKILINQFSSLKTNLPVDKCSLLMGVVDFYGVLEDDEVFVQLSSFETYERDLYDPGSYAEGGIVSGNVFVTRNPCLHPGDVRKLKAVSDDRINVLKHLKDVIVFSQKSKQSQASKMSGGDLDGDLFMVCWDPELLNFTEHKPMKHTQLKPLEKNDGFDYKAIRDFLKEYVVNDNLGVVAFMHMEHYDQSSKGALDQNCLDLADYHSHQVDYAKTGVRKALPMELVSEYRPHYMPKSFMKKTYHSTKIIGKSKLLRI